MNKQQLANKIWESANEMRSKIDASEYKDYILGFIFYKFLSEKEVEYLKNTLSLTENLDIHLKEEDDDLVKEIQRSIGYFISYDNLFSTWVNDKDFNIGQVTTALSAFKRLIHKDYYNVFSNIFDTLQAGLTKLGDSSASQTKAVKKLIDIVKVIPMNSKQDYDVLGFIYEYLISMFAANAGKKAGEFYTPHEVSVLISEIVADHLKDKNEIEIYDPTSGSGSLLINIGQSVAKHNENENGIKYYAQELKENTYNLTRMNLVMRGININNIFVRNGDTLEDDWPYFSDEGHKKDTYRRVRVDAVVSNPPYSQKWDSSDYENDERYEEYGLAPKSKADYAFLLHDLYHIKPDGIMAIVLPHGVLFRGGEEGTIRARLIEKGEIDTIIGLPSNIFFGTGIPTIIMILKKNRPTTDILIIDASKGFEKAGTKNKLRACDIKKITDVVKSRESIRGFSRCVSKEEIVQNDYNLNIPRYVDSSEKEDTIDIYATMFGGIPNSEINELNKYWDVFPSLKKSLFNSISPEYSQVVSEKTKEIAKIINENADIINFKNDYNNKFKEFDSFLTNELIQQITSVNLVKEEDIVAEYIFERADKIPLIDKYSLYQMLDNYWQDISSDIETIQKEGLDVIKTTDPIMKKKKVKGKETEVTVGWKGRIVPFNLVQETLLKDEYEILLELESKGVEINSELEELVENISEDDNSILNDDNSAFVSVELKNALKSIYEDIDLPEKHIFIEYLKLKGKKNKLEFQNNHREIDWSSMNANKDNTYGKTVITAYINEKLENYEFEKNSHEYIVKRASKLLSKDAEINKEIKNQKEELEKKTKETIETLTKENILYLLKLKWVFPIIKEINSTPNVIIKDIINQIERLAMKYKTTLSDIEKEIKDTEQLLTSMIDELVGNETDIAGLQEFKKILGGN